jgi:N-methylhydantoinase A
MRYTGQGEEISVLLPNVQVLQPDADTFKDLFEQEYITLFGRAVSGMDVEITVWSVNATTVVKPADPIRLSTETNEVVASGVKPVFDPAIGEFMETVMIERSMLKCGDSIKGPAAITESETTIVLPSSRQAICQADGCIDIVTQSQ